MRSAFPVLQPLVAIPALRQPSGHAEISGLLFFKPTPHPCASHPRRRRCPSPENSPLADDFCPEGHRR